MYQLLSVIQNIHLKIKDINYTYCKLYSKSLNLFNAGYKLAKNDLQKSEIRYIYEAGSNRTSLVEIFSELKIA